MTFTDLQAAIPELSPYQIDQISAQVARYMKLNEELRNTRPTVCPVCGEADVRFIKKGFQAGKQRYQCRAVDASLPMIPDRLHRIHISQPTHGLR